MAPMCRLPESTSWLACGALGLAAATAAACGGGGNSEPLKPDSGPRSGPVIALTEVAEFWPQAIVTGRLTKRGDCLFIDEVIAVFPDGTDWTPPAVTFPNGDRSRFDSRIRMGGGYFDVAGLSQKGSPTLPVSEVRACARRTGATEYALAAPIG